MTPTLRTMPYFIALFLVGLYWPDLCRLGRRWLDRRAARRRQIAAQTPWRPRPRRRRFPW